MAIAYGTIAQATGGSSETLTVGKPTSLAEGDLMIFGLTTDAATAVTLSGWTSAGSQSPGSGRIFQVYFKIASSADAAASDFTATLGTSRFWAGFIIRATDSAEDVQSDTGTDAATNVPSYSIGITPGQTNSLLIFALAPDAAALTTSNYAIVTDNPTWTERADLTIVGGSGGTLAVATAIRSESTATGNFSANISSSADSAGIICSFGTSIDVTVNANLITVNYDVKGEDAQASQTVSMGTLTVNSTVNAEITLIVDDKWSNTSKNAGANLSNTGKNAMANVSNTSKNAMTNVTNTTKN